MARKLLLIASVFPPNPGIGGRRWAKFAKVLSADGYEIHVLKPKKIIGETSLWSRDVLQPSIYVHTFNLAFQKLTDYTNRQFFNRIFRRLFYFFFKKSVYYFTDTSSLSIKEIKKTAISIIDQQEISTVVISANPNYYYVGYLLKKYYGDKINIILDYRDLWNDHSYYEIFFKRNKRQIAYSNKIENLALNHCDYLITVDRHMMNILEKRISNPEVKKKVIYNGFDKDDFKKFDLLHEKKRKDGQIDLFFAGSIGEDLTEVLKLFLNAFLDLEKLDPELFNRIKIEIYCNSNNSYIHQLRQEKRPANLILKENMITMDEYVTKLHNADYGLLFSSEEYSHSFFTKYYDYLYLHKRIVNVGYLKGDLSGFIENAAIGLSFIKGHDYSFFKELQNDFALNKEQYLSKEYIQQFDIAILKNEFIEVMNELERK